MTNDPPTSRVLQLGMIGLDTSHSVEFARRLNHPAENGHVPGARITAALQSSSPDMPMSRDRVGEFTREMQERHDVRLVQSVDELLAECDAVLLCSLDGRPHLEQFKSCARGKPVFVDKPIAASLKDAVELYTVAIRTGTPMFSAS